MYDTTFPYTIEPRNSFPIFIGDSRSSSAFTANVKVIFDYNLIKFVKTMCIMYILYAISTWGIKCECPCFKVKVDI